MVLLPIGADQPLNAARCEALGVARVLDPFLATGTDVAAATAGVLAEASYRRNAERLRDEIDALPGPQQALRLVEELRRRPRAGRA
jgi:UDP:flavonoid glycosyltransferase YjiC (YdhE family)